MIRQRIERTLRYLAAAEGSAGGRPRLVLLDHLAVKLALTWRDHTGLLPTATNRKDGPRFLVVIETVLTSLGAERSALRAARTAVQWLGNKTSPSRPGFRFDSMLSDA